MKTIRLLPIVILAASALLVLKVAGLVTGGGYVLMGTTQLAAQESTADEGPSEADLTAADIAARALFESVPFVQDGGTIPTRDFAAENSGEISNFAQDDTEQVILERLAARRAALDELARELDLRLAVIEAAEARIEERLGELAAIEDRINITMDEQEAREAEQFTGLVAMYENMRPADAAAIFNDLDMTVLLRVGQMMNPRKLGPIMAKMLPARAQELTVRMAMTDGSDQAGPDADNSFANLPQIVGQ